jgi:PPOX class probable F420-dependent enzyme
MKDMSPEEARRFLLNTARTGKLATVREDGRPHVTAIWFDLDGETLVFTTWHKSVKTKNLRHDPRVSMCVDDERPPYAYVIVEGTAEITDPPDEERLYWATRIATRYMGEELGRVFGKRNGVSGEHIVRVTPTKIIGHKGIQD